MNSSTLKFNYELWGLLFCRCLAMWKLEFNAFSLYISKAFPRKESNKAIAQNMKTLEQLYHQSMNLLKRTGAHYREFQHEPVFNYETAAKVRATFGIKGVESKNLFLRTKEGRFCMLITLEGKRADLKAIKEVLASKVSIASDEELKQQTGCEPGCAVPFGHDPNITLLVDKTIFEHERIIFSPGPPDRTVELEVCDIKNILSNISNPVFYI